MDPFYPFLHQRHAHGPCSIARNTSRVRRCNGYTKGRDTRVQVGEAELRDGEAVG